MNSAPGELQLPRHATAASTGAQRDVYLPQTRHNLDKSPHNRETRGYGRIQNKDRRVQGPQIEAREMFLSLTTHSGAVSRVISLSRRCDGWTAVNLGGKNPDISVSVCAHALHNHAHNKKKRLCQPPSDASQHVRLQMNVWARCVPLEAGCRFHILLCL